MRDVEKIKQRLGIATNKPKANDGSYVAIPKCYFCGQDKNIILLSTKLQDISKAHGAVIDKEPCDKFASLMQQGIMLIECKEEPKQQGAEPYRTGNIAVMKQEACERVFSGIDFNTQRYIFIPKEISDAIGLFNQENTEQDEAERTE
jgi:hypothetical protein